ncbi:MAG: DUF3048 domain-containing protein [Lachnospiraceae bacterium]|nr:DUF3048 domain-containing protein [Lachnospiraceae bacterium]
MKKRIGIMITMALAAVMLFGCSKKEEDVPDLTSLVEPIPVELPTEQPAPPTPEPTEAPPEGKYRSELTNEWIDEELKDQRPVAIMVDNESLAWDHYGVNQADIVFEMMNSTANGRITRLMCIVKDYEKITQFGSIRSIRPTNFLAGGAFNAIYLHDGGPFYINDYLAMPEFEHISGTFARVPNGKDSTYTEYVTGEDYKNPKTGKNYTGLIKQLEDGGFDRNYNQYYEGQSLKFAEDEVDLSGESGSISATKVVQPFPHTTSTLKYDEESGKYNLYCYDKLHVDAEDDNKATEFENAIVLCCDHVQLDENGYMLYNFLTSTPKDGYYLTRGKAVPIQWINPTYTSPITFLNKDGSERLLNTGKTYISIVPEDSWDKLEIE